MTIASAELATIEMVSLSDSPLDELEVVASEKPMTRPPSLFTAVSKLRRVRVEGSKKSVAMTRPSSSLRLGFCSKSSARSSRRMMSSTESWLIDTKCFISLSSMMIR